MNLQYKIVWRSGNASGRLSCEPDCWGAAGELRRRVPGPAWFARLGSVCVPLAVLLHITGSATAALPFQLPTANRALFEKDGEERFFVGTAGKPWPSGTFGCVRSDGWQMHEGIDIRSVQKDKRGEPMDPVLAAADGVVAYINHEPGLSNYGRYLVIRHRLEGLDFCSLYAHLSATQAGLKTGSLVTAGQRIATMGRTANTRQPITRDRAHLHFEINLLVNDRFPAWFQRTHPGERNDHGLWNGQNLLGLDPRELLLQQHALGDRFSLRDFIRNQRELCRVRVRAGNLAWARRFPSLVRRNLKAEREGVAAYELRLNSNGVPFQLAPLAPSELPPGARIELISVNAAEQRACPCRRLVQQKGGVWELTGHGRQLLDLLTF